jgi:plasmid stability protein
MVYAPIFSPKTGAIFMNPSETIATQVNLSRNLYQWLERQAQFKGHSVEDEIAEVLMAAVVGDDGLSAEMAQWEAASDEDELEFNCIGVSMTCDRS